MVDEFYEKRRKLTYFGNIMRCENKSLEKSINQRTLPENKKRGRPKTAWMDNVTSWTGLREIERERERENFICHKTTQTQ